MHCRGPKADGVGGDTKEKHVWVSADSLRKALKGWGLTLDEENVFAFLKRFDENDDGCINFTSFCVLLAEVMQPGSLSSYLPDCVLLSFRA